MSKYIYFFYQIFLNTVVHEKPGYSGKIFTQIKIILYKTRIYKVFKKLANKNHAMPESCNLKFFSFKESAKKPGVIIKMSVFYRLQKELYGYSVSVDILNKS